MMTFPRYGKIKHVPNHQPEHSYGKSSSGWWCNNHLEKYEFVNFVRIIPCMKWKMTHEFETTNQSFLSSVNQLFLWAMASIAILTKPDGNFPGQRLTFIQFYWNTGTRCISMGQWIWFYMLSNVYPTF